MAFSDKELDSFLDDTTGAIKLTTDADIDDFLDDKIKELPVSQDTPKFYEIEKQDGVPRDALALLKQAARQVAEGATSPMPGSILALPARAVQENANQVGSDVAKGFSTKGGLLPDIGKVPARAAGFLASLATDPTTVVTGAGAAQVGGHVTRAGLRKVAPAVLKTIADVPEEATRVLLQTKDLFKKATGSTGAIESAVTNVQKALNEALAKEGRAITAVEKKLGIHRTPEQIRKEMVEGADIGGFMDQLSKMSSADLLKQYEQMKPVLSELSPGSRISQLRALQQTINSRVGSFTSAGDSLQGLLKSTGKEIGEAIKNIPGGELLRAVQAKYSRARKLHDSLQSLLKNNADEGQAEQILQNVFKSDAPRYKSIRRGLAELEKLSGQPVFTQMFQEFAAKSLNKINGRPFVAGAGLSALGTGLATLNPVVAGAGALTVAAQSPRVLSRALPAAANTVAATSGVAGGSLAALFNRVAQRAQPISSIQE